MFGPADLTDDAFLGGYLQIWQPRDGYRAATDPVLLAACAPARAGMTVLDIGAGVGTAALCLAARVPGLTLSALEVQPDYADLARRNAARAEMELEVITGDLLAMPPTLRRGFDLVLSNPPYFPATGTPARDPGRDLAMRAEVPLADWIVACARRVLPGGWMVLILRAEGLSLALGALALGRLGSVSILPLAARERRAAGRVVIRARKGGRASLRLLAPLILHAAPQHPGDGEDHSPEAARIFRGPSGLCHLFEKVLGNQSPGPHRNE